MNILERPRRRQTRAGRQAGSAENAAQRGRNTGRTQHPEWQQRETGEERRAGSEGNQVAGPRITPGR